MKSPGFPSQIFSIPKPLSTRTNSIRTRPSSAASTCQTNATSLYLLQTKDGVSEGLEPLDEDIEPRSFDLLTSDTQLVKFYSLGKLCEQHEGIEHGKALSNWQRLRVIIQDGSLSDFDKENIPDLAAKIGGSDRARDELVRALEDGTIPTARIRWISKHDTDGRPRWVHCTPLLGSNRAVGVLVVVLVDGDEQVSRRQSWRMAPPMDPLLTGYNGRMRSLPPGDEMDLDSLLSMDVKQVLRMD